MGRRFILLITLLLCANGFMYGADFCGNNLTAVLGISITSPQFKEFRTYWVLNKSYESNFGGIKIYVNDITGKVESILIAGDGFEAGGEKFSKCTSKLPFGISMTDDTAVLSAKLGIGEKLLGRNALRFYKKDFAIEVTYTALRGGKINSIKFFKDETAHPLSPKKASAPVYTAAPINNDSKISVAPTVQKVVVPLAPFKKAVMDIFRASRESGFSNVKGDARSESNFWNYKYTYNTKLAVPGELYGMLYNFPFVNSQTDFVAVIKEGDRYSMAFDSAYHRFEKLLQENFKPSDGWTSACVAGSNKSRLPNLEVRNDKIGSIILDYSENPKGKPVLYLRFLFFSN